jgi:hypothetical protein
MVELHKHEQCHKRAKQTLDNAKRLLGLEGNGLCFGVNDNGYSIELTLAAYLAMFGEDIVPVKQSFTYDGRQREYLKYPDKYIGQKNGLHLWVSARTRAIDAGPAPQEEPAAA